MSDLTVRSFANISDVSTETLKAELARALEVTAENLLWMARLWRELERRGEDLRELRSGLRTFLPLISDGRLDAQAAVQFAGNLTMLRALSSLPIKEQRRIAAGGTVPVVMIRDGAPITRNMKADDISARMVKQVFATGRVRNEDEQKLIVTTLHPERAKQARKVERIRLDSEKVALWRRVAARRNVSLEDLIVAALDPIVAEERQRGGPTGPPHPSPLK